MTTALLLTALMSTVWGQGTPFNDQCPQTADGQHYVSGCVATAMAQIMRHYEYPEHGRGYHSYRFTPATGSSLRLSADFESTYYDWAAMASDYSDGTYTEQQAEAVSTLMAHCGVAVEMQYSASGSGAFTYQVVQAMHQFFGYHENAVFLNRDYYSTAEWTALLRHELEAGRPVLYSASSAGIGGHAFVVDGIDDEGRVHVNWGWNGDCNGYYELDDLSPRGRDYHFTASHGMILGMAPETEAIRPMSQFALDADLSVSRTGSGIAVHSQGVFSLAARTFSGMVALVAEDEGGVQHVLRYQPVADIGYGDGFPLAWQQVELGELPPGTYQLYLASRMQGEERLQVVRCKAGTVNCYRLRLTDGGIGSLYADGYQPTAIHDAAAPTSGPVPGARRYSLQGTPLSGGSQPLIYIYRGKKYVQK